MGIIDRIAKQLLQPAQIIEKRQLTPHTFQLKIQGENLKNLNYIPGQHLRIFIGMGQATPMSDKVRTYSIWGYHPEKQTIDMAVCTHSNGAGAQWVKNLEIGETIYLKGPEGKFTVDHSGDFYLLIGDTSALAHLYEINRNLGDKKIHSLIYAQHEEEYFPDLDGQYPLALTTMPQNPSNEIIRAIQAMLRNCTGKGMVYVGGDGRICVSLHQYFRKELSWSSSQIKTKPFWMPGKKGLE